MGSCKLGEDGSLGLLERKRLSNGFVGLIETDFCSVGIAGASDVDGKIIIDDRRKDISTVNLSSMPCKAPSAIIASILCKTRMVRETRDVVWVAKVQPRLNVLKSVLTAAKINKGKLLCSRLISTIQLYRSAGAHRTAWNIEHSMPRQSRGKKIRTGIKCRVLRRIRSRGRRVRFFNCVAFVRDSVLD